MFRNKEFLRFSVLLLILSGALTAIGFMLNNAAGFLVLASSAAFGAAFFMFTRSRYRSLARLSKQIDLVLHHADRFELYGFDEGELSILQNDITKMTLRIREQNDILIKDKQYLADSLADIAHQLRTPLTSANLILSFLAGDADEAKRQAFIRELEELLVRMDWLMTTLLKLSRLDAGVIAFQHESISIPQLIGAALRPLAIPMELRSVNIQTDIPANASIQGDLNWLSEALQNILKNAMESAGENGRINITCTDNNLYTELFIHDNGPGFDPADLPHLFDRFYRSGHNHAAGYGIGLALSKTIVTRSGGTITAKNHPEVGAVFAIRFPKTA